MEGKRGEIVIQQVPQLYQLRKRALIAELVGYGPGTNTDRVSALAQVMFYREHFIILYGGAPTGDPKDSDDVSDDSFFDQDWRQYQFRHNKTP